MSSVKTEEMNELNRKTCACLCVCVCVYVVAASRSRMHKNKQTSARARQLARNVLLFNLLFKIIPSIQHQ